MHATSARMIPRSRSESASVVQVAVSKGTPRCMKAAITTRVSAPAVAPTTGA